MNVREKKPTRPVWLTVVSQSAVEGDTERTEFMTEGDLVWEGETP